MARHTVTVERWQGGWGAWCDDCEGWVVWSHPDRATVHQRAAEHALNLTPEDSQP